MKKNVGTIDKAIRIIAALLIVVLYFGSIISGTWAIILIVLAGILVATSFISFCPLYFLFKISTHKNEQKD